MKGNRFFIIVIVIVSCCVILSCNTYEPYYSESSSDWAAEKPSGEIKHQLIFSGENNFEFGDKISNHLQSIVTKEGANNRLSSFVFLGNVFNRSFLKKEEQKTISTLHTFYKQFPGRIYMINGNNEWNNSKKNSDVSLENYNRMTFLAEQADKLAIAEAACPGPFAYDLTNNTVLLTINSQWWFHDIENDKKLIKDCEIQSREEFLTELKSFVTQYFDKNIIIAMHHPLISKGERGGKFSFRDHIFPLTNIHKKLYIPLPVIGSLYPTFKYANGTSQDMVHPNYQTLKDAILELTEKNDNIVFLSSHEDGSQYFEKDDKHFVVSGHVEDKAYIRKSKKAGFLSAAPGYGKLIEYEDGSLWLEFWSDPKDNSKLLYRKALLKKQKSKEKLIKELNSKYSVDHGSLKTVHGSDLYEVGGFKRFWLGEHYRKVWVVPFDVEVLDLSITEGGLKPIKRGGGFATRSLRMENSKGKQFVLRTVDKRTETTLPEFMRNTFVANIVQDQTAASHPYASIVIPTLADAVNIYHANPKLVYIPHQAALAEFDEVFGDDFYVFEERPNKNMEGHYSFGNSENVMSYTKAIQKTNKHHDHRIDQNWVLRSRVFDMLIGDWDRHDDQWRWATFDEDDIKWYRPIPRDRDQPFFKFDGVLPWIASRKWLFRAGKFQDYEETQHNIVGFNFNARYFDRAFLNEMDWSDWQKEIEAIKRGLTDEIIEKSFKSWDEAIYNLDAEEIISDMKARRDHLDEMLYPYYKFLSREVNIVGTDDDELIEIKRLENNETQIQIFHLSKKGNKKELMFSRVFDGKITKDIRIYGLKGADRVEIDGKVKKGIRIRFVGGKGEDRVVDRSKVGGLIKKNLIYDKPGGMKIEANGETKDKTSKRKDVNEYNRFEYKYRAGMPLLVVGYNNDDGVFLGLGYTYKNQGFRKEPFKATHSFGGSYSFKTKGYTGRYKSYFVEALGKLDLELDVRAFGVNYVRKFYGLSNESIDKDPDNDAFNRIRMTQVIISPRIAKTFREIHSLEFGPIFTLSDVERTENRFVDDPGSGLTDMDFENQNEIGLGFEYRFDKVDNSQVPSRGVRFNTSTSWTTRVDDLDVSSTHFTLEGIVYYQFDIFLKPTIAIRAGSGINIGDFDFHESNTLGEKTNLRGFTVDRYSGDRSFYQNNELRITLGEVRTVIFPFSVGLLGFYDLGRVWVDGEESDVWHRGYGGGLWLSPFNLLAITATYAQSTEDKRFIFKFGFQF